MQAIRRRMVAHPVGRRETAHNGPRWVLHGLDRTRRACNWWLEECGHHGIASLSSIKIRECIMAKACSCIQQLTPSSQTCTGWPLRQRLAAPSRISSSVSDCGEPTPLDLPPSTAPTRENWCIELASYHRLLNLKWGINCCGRRWTGKSSPGGDRRWQTTGRHMRRPRG